MSALARTAMRLALPLACLAMGSNVSAQSYGRSVTSNDGAASATLPCDEPMDSSQGVAGLEAWVCILGDVAYMFVYSSGQGLLDFDPFASDYDAARAAIGDSPDTTDLEEGFDGGRRTITASRSAETGLGLMRAVELSEDRMVYTIVVSQDDGVPVSDTQRAQAQGFISSLRVAL